MILFGVKPGRYLPHAEVTVVVYPGTDKDYTATERRTLRGPAVALLAASSEVVELGVIGQALEFVRRNTCCQVWIDEGGWRNERWDYPFEAVREAVVNGVAHRDYTITVTDIELSIYTDRIGLPTLGRSAQ